MDLTIPTFTGRPAPREIGSEGMMMTYSDPQIIAEQIIALKSLGLIDAAMPSIEKHNPVIAAAISSGTEHFLNYQGMREEPQEYRYEGADGAGFIGQTTSWVAYLHYELQTVALFGLMELLENGELNADQIADYSVALGDTKVDQNAFLAFNFNPHRQPDEFFDVLKARLRLEGFDKIARGYDSFYKVPAFIWGALNGEQRGRMAAEIIGRDFNVSWGSYDSRVLGREFGKLLSSIFAWNEELNKPALVEGISRRIFFDYRERFTQGHIEISDEGFLWIEELRGLTSAV